MDIFISYSSKDIEIVTDICEKIKKHGFEYWVAHENGKFGGQFAATIIEEINKCQIFLVFISKASNLSTHVINEINSAVMRNKIIVPVMIGKVKLSPAMEYYISSNHYLIYNESDPLFYNTLIKRLSDILNGGVEEAEDSGIDIDDDTENSELLAAAAEGDAEAMCELGRRYYHGTDGLEKNLFHAANYFRRAAELKHPEAICNLGWCYEAGEGVEQDWQKAYECYRRSAELDCAMAQYSLGWMYDNGIYVKKNKSVAMNWYIKAAEGGQGMAQYRLGMAYMDGLCVDCDHIMANHWLMLAADQGVVFAQYQLAENYYFGRGCKKDIIKAKNMWLLASSRGYDRADYALEKYYDIYYANANKSFIV